MMGFNRPHASHSLVYPDQPVLRGVRFFHVGQLDVLVANLYTTSPVKPQRVTIRCLKTWRRGRKRKGEGGGGGRERGREEGEKRKGEGGGGGRERGREEGKREGIDGGGSQNETKEPRVLY